MQTTDFDAILRLFSESGVEFIVVGGVSAVLQGAPVNTFDLDIVHRRAPENIQRVLAALDKLDAYYRLQRERRLRPNASHLQSLGHHLLTTSAGYLDLLGSIGDFLTYEDLVEHSEPMQIAEGSCVPVLKLDTLISLKQQAGREKDIAMLPILRRTLEEKRRLAAIASQTKPSPSDPSS